MKISFLRPLVVVCGLLIFSCNQDSNSITTDNESIVNRPHDPWVFRSVLDKIPRVITLAIHDKMWLSYATQSASLYKAWRGSVNFEGPVYNKAHGPQPTSAGEAYMINPLSPRWKLLNNGNEVDFEIHWKGHEFKNGRAILKYQIKSNNTLISILEIPNVQEDQNGVMSFSRNFKVSGLTEGTNLVLSETVNSVVVKENISSNGKLSFAEVTKVQDGKKSFELPTYQLEFEADGDIDLNIQFFDATIADPNIEYEKPDNNGPSGALLIAKHGCKTCHNKNVKTIGPAYLAIAERYQDTDENKLMLREKIKTGGSGKWGNQMMNPHPEVPINEIKDMVDYILSLSDPEITDELSEENVLSLEPQEVDENNLIPGAVVRIFNIPTTTLKVPTNWEKLKPIQAGVLPNFDNINGSDFTDLDEHFALHAKGYFYVKESGVYDMRIWSDDGSKVSLNDVLVLDHDGPHSTSMKEVKLDLKSGYYPFKIEFFQGRLGRFLSWNYKSPSSDKWEVIPDSMILHDKADHSLIGSLGLPMAHQSTLPGDRCKLESVHPSFNLYQARPDDFEPMVGGLDFMSDGSMIVSTWEPDGGIYKLSNLKAEDHNDIVVTKIASGLAEPLGVCVVDDEIYIMQKQELTQLIDMDNDGLIDAYNTICDAWEVSANFHEFGFGLEYKDGHFYAALATAIEPGGASVKNQIKDRGKAIKINKKTGEIEYIAHGLRTPNGVGRAYNDEIFIADNEGDWLPSSKIVHVQKGAWYGSRSVDFEGTENLEETKPLVWLPQNEIGNSPTTPSYLNLGPYKGQMIHGEVTHGGVKRVFVEEVNGKLQGCVFRFIQGIEAGVNRLRWGPDGELYVGGIGNPGNWQQNGKKWFGLQRLKYNNNCTFEMLAVRAKSNGLEIEFTEELKNDEGWDPNAYEVKRWWYKPTENYGGPKMDETQLVIKSATVSEDRKKVFLEFDGLKDNHIYYLRLKKHFVSEINNSLWSTEAWYTMNHVPNDNMGTSKERPVKLANNALSQMEKEQGWELLFDGKSIDKWHNYNKKTVGKSWVIDNDAMHLNSQQKPDGTWAAIDGGDLISNKEYENFELKLEWKISNCGNSGIMFNVQESDKYCCPWWTGPEMQILDNTCHPDTKFPTHRAGDLYDMIECKYVTVKPAGEWNQVRILSNEAKVEFWLNGYMVVAFSMFDDNWRSMITNSKFNEMPGFGEFKSGHFCLQDHSDKVWFRNIKVRSL